MNFIIYINTLLPLLERCASLIQDNRLYEFTLFLSKLHLYKYILIFRGLHGLVRVRSHPLFLVSHMGSPLVMTINLPFQTIKHEIGLVSFLGNLLNYDHLMY